MKHKIIRKLSTTGRSFCPYCRRVPPRTPSPVRSPKRKTWRLVEVRDRLLDCGDLSPLFIPHRTRDSPARGTSNQSADKSAHSKTKEASTMSDPQRKSIDCRDYPSDSGCTLRLEGTEEEVLEAAVSHAITRHGHTNNP